MYNHIIGCSHYSNGTCTHSYAYQYPSLFPSFPLCPFLIHTSNLHACTCTYIYDCVDRIKCTREWSSLGLAPLANSHISHRPKCKNGSHVWLDVATTVMAHAHIVIYTSIQACFLYFTYHPYMSLFSIL